MRTIEGMTYLKNCGCKVVAITDNETSPPAQIADYTLTAKSYMNSFVDLSLIHISIGERAVFVYAQDYTVLSGSLSAAHASKIIKVMDMAAKNGVPVIGILDSGGARISEGVAAIGSTAAILNKYSELSGVVPTLTVVAGPCIGTAAYIAAVSDFTFMTDGISEVALQDVYKRQGLS